METAVQPRGSSCTVPAPGRRLNAMSVDVEEHFQVHAFAGQIDRGTWSGHESRVERNTERVLQAFSDHGAKSTFFVLGWIAERHPGLIRRIVTEGHELASHGYCHIRADAQSPAEFREDIRRTKALLEEAGGVAVRGYRAASFSIGKDNWWAFDVLAEEGYRYSSSIFPIHHDQYGVPSAPRDPFIPSPRAGGLIELPMSTVRIFGQNLPCSGGGYFRIFPYWLFQQAVRRLNRRENRPCMFYFHPWEVDPDQPRIPGAPLKSRLRHYTNLKHMEAKLRRLLGEFAWDRVDRVYGLDTGPRKGQ
jgi:polysaccharide deacetylase family protein (PEP-CTERM system associated)